MLTKFEVTQNEIEYAINQFNKAYRTSEKFRKIIDENPERVEKIELEKLQTAVLISLCKSNNWKFKWLNKVFQTKRSHKSRIMEINGIPYYVKFNTIDYPIDEHSKITITANLLNWCKDNNINNIIFGIYVKNEDCFYFGMIDIDRIPIIGKFHEEGSRRNDTSNYYKDCYVINTLDLSKLSFK